MATGRSARAALPQVVAGPRGRRVEEIPGRRGRARPGTRRSRRGGIGGWGRGPYGKDEDRTAALLPPARGRVRLPLLLPDGGVEPVAVLHSTWRSLNSGHPHPACRATPGLPNVRRSANWFLNHPLRNQCCGQLRTDLGLDERVFACHSCGLRIGRDLNSAINREPRDRRPQCGGDGKRLWRGCQPGPRLGSPGGSRNRDLPGARRLD